ncbi:hypothetical protein [Arthrobacter wenxiniae]|jgi:hypothetical protein|uniref:Uncharacterized protein n=1 Tax=Arthrobacter wenxiniae TaxID=2713570 RepID=A0A7Y7LX59_9MICC|nr:hypothetical protein [Arthrobacter wenxiniae]NVM94000.1 hypothetical protein [Arthrobacter wenxiniae]
MRGKQRTIDSALLGPMIQEETAYPLWCDHCGTDAYILIESVRRRHFAPADHLDVTYFCSQCDAIYGHLVKESEIKAEFMAAIAVAGRPQAIAEDAGFTEAS